MAGYHLQRSAAGFAIPLVCLFVHLSVCLSVRLSVRRLLSPRERGSTRAQGGFFSLQFIQRVRLCLVFRTQTDRQTDRQIDKQTDRKTDRQTIWFLLDFQNQEVLEFR